MNDFDNGHVEETKGVDGARESRTPTLKTVSIGNRFVHWLVDMIVMYAVFFMIGIVIRMFGLYSIGRFIQFHPFICGVTGFFIYYVFCESIWGRTVGKLCTNSIVVAENGGKPAFATILLRTLIRNVPFEPFSILSSSSKMWHDTWVKTVVVKEASIKPAN